MKNMYNFVLGSLQESLMVDVFGGDGATTAGGFATKIRRSSAGCVLTKASGQPRSAASPHYFESCTAGFGW